MSVFEVHSGGDRRSLIKRFMNKSKQDAVSQLVDIHLSHCSRAERLEAEIEALRKDAERYRWLRDGADYCDTRDIPGMAPARMDAFIDAGLAKVVKP